MFYVAMVDDVNPMAHARIQSAYMTVFPCVYIDAGYRAKMGGAPAEYPEDVLVPYYEPEIIASGQRVVPALDMLTTLDWLGNNQVRVHVAVGNGVPANTAPPTPSIVMGGGQRLPLQNMQFASEATDPEANMIYYWWDWGDGQNTGWLGPYNSGASALASHSWTDFGNYEVKVKVKDAFGAETAWSAPVSVKINCCMGRVGDANGTGGDEPTIGDVSVMIDAKFITGTCISSGIGTNIVCLGEGDINLSGGVIPTCDAITIGDISALIDYLFITGPARGLPDCP